MKEKGFTLIELLAVIVILAIIALIAVPIILNIINGAAKSAFKETAHGIVDAGEFLYSKKQLKEEIKQDVTYTFPNNIEGLEFEGEVPKKGTMTVNAAGEISIAVSNGKYCAIKSFTDSEVTVTEDNGNCISSTNVVIAYAKPIEIDACKDMDLDDKSVCDINIVGSEKTKEFTSNNGKFLVQEDKIVYSPIKFMDGIDSLNYIIEVKDEKGNVTTNSYGTLNIVPATSMYYETDFVDGIFEFQTIANSWSIVGNSVSGNQDSYSSDSTNHNEIYGYDSSYKSNNGLSNNSSYFVEGEGKDKTLAKFTFTGTGIDLIGRLGKTEGMIRLRIYDASGTVVKSMSTLCKFDVELYQVPFITIRDLPYGTYNAVIDVFDSYQYTGAFASLSRDNDFHFDAVKIYNTMGTTNQLANSIYKADGEFNPIISELKDSLVTKETFSGLGDTETTGSVCFSNTNGTIETIDCETSNNELFLNSNQGVALKIYNEGSVIPASFQLGAKTIYSGEKANLNITICSGDNTTCTTKNVMNEEIQTFAYMNYDVLNGSTSKFSDFFKTDANGKKAAYMIIQNTGTGTLAISDVKIAYDKDIENSSTSFAVSSEILNVISSAVN